MTGETYAASIAALATFVTALGVVYRSLTGDRFNRKISESASLLSGYTTMVKTLQEQIASIEKRHKTDREEWQTEKRSLRAEHAQEVRELREEHAQEVEALSRRIDRLSAQVDLLENRSPHSKDRQSD